MLRTKLSTKGQIVLPKNLRASHDWRPGTEFLLEDTEEGVLLKPLKPLKLTRLEEVLGCSGYKGPAKSLQQMERAIQKGAKSKR